MISAELYWPIGAAALIFSIAAAAMLLERAAELASPRMRGGRGPTKLLARRRIPELEGGRPGYKAATLSLAADGTLSLHGLTHGKDLPYKVEDTSRCSSPGCQEGPELYCTCGFYSFNLLTAVEPYWTEHDADRVRLDVTHHGLTHEYTRGTRSARQSVEKITTSAVCGWCVRKSSGREVTHLALDPDLQRTDKERNRTQQALRTGCYSCTLGLRRWDLEEASRKFSVPIQAAPWPENLRRRHHLTSIGGVVLHLGKRTQKW